VHKLFFFLFRAVHSHWALSYALSLSPAKPHVSRAKSNPTSVPPSHAQVATWSSKESDVPVESITSKSEANKCIVSAPSVPVSSCRAGVHVSRAKSNPTSVPPSHAQVATWSSKERRRPRISQGWEILGRRRSLLLQVATCACEGGTLVGFDFARLRKKVYARWFFTAEMLPHGRGGIDCNQLVLLSLSHFLSFQGSA
jgi:hypothetical protein